METAPSGATPPALPTATSVAAKLFNVFAAPGEVFEELKAFPPKAANWLWPAIINAIAGAITVVVLFSQPTIQRQIRQQQEKEFEKQVQAGKMTQQQADQALTMMEKFSGPFTTIAGAVGAAVVGFVRLFWWGLILMLAAKWVLKTELAYLKAVEVAGLASMIFALAALVGALLGVILGRMYASISLGLLVENFDPSNRVHGLLGATNIFNFWFFAVLGLGWARVTGTAAGRGVLISVGAWTVIVLLLNALKMGSFTL